MFCNMVYSLVNRFRTVTHACVVGDKGGKPTFRHRLYPMYKGNRPPLPDDLRAQIAAARVAGALFWRAHGAVDVSDRKGGAQIRQVR
jgi:5'-3' exonuclease, N-terminal resolvase-like domain